MGSIQSENLFAFLHQGYPLYCPYCHRDVNIISVDYINHSRKHPSTCMYCKTVWKKKVSQWVDAEELARLRSKLPSVSFEELAALQMDVLEKQPPLTSEQKREQILRIEIQSSAFTEQRIKEILKLQHSGWTHTQIETEYQRLMTLYKP